MAKDKKRDSGEAEPKPKAVRKEANAALTAHLIPKSSSKEKLARSNSDSSLSNSEDLLSVFGSSREASPKTSRAASPAESPAVSPPGSPPKSGWVKAPPRAPSVPSFMGVERLMASYNELDTKSAFQRTVEEFIKTELVFKEGLHVLVTACNNILNDSELVENLKLSPREIENIKKYLEPYEFLNEHHNVLHDKSKLKDIINIPQNINLKVFKEIVVQHPKADAFFKELFKQNKKLHDAMVTEIQSLTDKPNTFEMYFITPIQRPPRYMLLANDLSKRNPIPEGGAALGQLVNFFSAAGKDINETKRMSETNEKLKPIYDIIIVLAKAQSRELFEKLLTIEVINDSYENKMKMLITLAREMKETPNYHIAIHPKITPNLFPAANTNDLRDLAKLEKIMVMQAWGNEMSKALLSLQTADPDKTFPKEFRDSVDSLKTMIDKWMNMDVGQLVKKDKFSKYEKEYEEAIKNLKENIIPKVQELESQPGRFSPTAEKPSRVIAAMIVRNADIFETPAQPLRTPSKS